MESELNTSITNELKRIGKIMDKAEDLKKQARVLERQYQEERRMLERRCKHDWQIDRDQWDPGHTWKYCTICYAEK